MAHETITSCSAGRKSGSRLDIHGQSAYSKAIAGREVHRSLQIVQSFVGKMQASGVMGGTGNNRFSPKGNYTREQSICTMLSMLAYLQEE